VGGGGGGGGGGRGGGGGDHIEPSAADVEAAIEEGAEEINVAEGSVAGEGSAMAGVMAAQGGAVGSGAAHGAKTMNAFELINMCGGLALSRMFQSTEEKKVKRFTQFVSPRPAGEIMARAQTVLQEMGCEITVEEPALKMKAISQTPKGAVGIIVQLYAMAEALHFVEIRRGKGDIFEFHKFYLELLEKLADLKGPSGTTG